MQSQAKPFEDLSNLMTNAFGAAKGVGDEVRAVFRSRADEFIADMDLVSREEFEVVKEMAANARIEIEELKAQIAALKK